MCRGLTAGTPQPRPDGRRGKFREVWLSLANSHVLFPEDVSLRMAERTTDAAWSESR